MQIPRQERIIIINRLGKRELFQNGLDPGVRLQTVELCGLYQRIEYGTGVSACWRIGKEPRSAAYNEGPDGIFGHVMPTPGLCRFVNVDLGLSCR